MNRRKNKGAWEFERELRSHRAAAWGYRAIIAALSAWTIIHQVVSHG